MVRLLAQAIVALIANGIGLFAASALLDGFSIEGVSFVVAVLIFSATTFILGPLIVKIALTNASFLVGGVSLVTILIGLIVTDLFTDGISIDGLSTWVVATLIIWIFAMLANLIVPLFLFKKVLSKNEANRNQQNHIETS